MGKHAMFYAIESLEAGFSGEQAPRVINAIYIDVLSLPMDTARRSRCAKRERSADMTAR